MLINTVLFSVLLHYTLAAKLNVPKLLLPYYSSVAVNFTLEVNEGCFKWRSTRPEVASVRGFHGKNPSDCELDVTPASYAVEEKCSQKAVVTATSRVPTRKVAILIAEDPLTGEQLRCDVIVDEIKSLAIETTTHELFLDDSPEKLKLRAMNDEDDVFSTLEGIAFVWNILPDTEFGQNHAAPNQILRFMPYFESSYKAPCHIRQLESQNKRGDRMLVRGIGTGSARVSSRPEDPVYETISDAAVRIIVMANLQINPAVVYIIERSTIFYRVEVIKHNKIQPIPMPSTQYYLVVQNTTIAELNENSITLTGLLRGYTEVFLKDRHINFPGMFREPAAAVNVVAPGYLEFRVFPGRLWILETNRTYEIVVEIFDKESHRIHPSDNIRVQVEFPVQYFKILSSSENGTYHVVRTKQAGLTHLFAELPHVVLPDNKLHAVEPPIHAKQDVEIFDPICVRPRLVVLPWTQDPLHRHDYQLIATGGSGNYTWSSQDQDVAVVTASGQVVTATTKGETIIKASDARNIAHFDTSKVIVAQPKFMEFLPSPVEAEIGSTLVLHLAVYVLLQENKGANKTAVDACYHMPVKEHIRDDTVFSFVTIQPTSAQGACMDLVVKATGLGHTLVKVLYVYQNHRLEADVTIAAYEPLRAVDPDDVAVVTPGSSREIVFEGGPQPWVLDPSHYYETLTAEQPKVIKGTVIRAPGNTKKGHVFRVECMDLGEQVLNVTVGNTPSETNRFPANSTAFVTFACEVIAAMRLVPITPVPKDLPPCPINTEFDEQIPVLNNGPVKIGIIVTDKKGRRFDNFTSVVVTWELSDPTMASLGKNPGTLITDVYRNPQTGKTSFSNHKELIILEKTGPLHVSARISNYQPFVHLLNKKWSNVTINLSDTRHLQVVENSVLSPDFLFLYNHKDSKGMLSVLKGSGYFYVLPQKDVVADAVYDDKGQQVVVRPLKEGQSLVVVADLCLENPNPPQATVFVSDVYRIVQMVVDKVQIYKEIEAVVQVYDRAGQPINAKHFSKMNLRPQIGTEIITLRKKEADGNRVSYIIRGIALGRTPLHFVATQTSGAVIRSEAQELQVFSPLQLDPRNITLIPGCLFQLIATGGPQPHSTIEFSITNTNIASVNSSGLVYPFALGITQVKGKAVGIDPETGKEVVYSQDEVTINVVELDAIKIHAPLKRIQSGSRMPMYAVGLQENLTPLSLGCINQPLLYAWGTSNNQVAVLRPLFEESGIHPPPENNFAVRFIALEPGHVTVTLTVRPVEGSINQIHLNAKLSVVTNIQVYPRLMMILPSICTDHILITPNTETLIKTNRDGSTSKMSYHVFPAGLVTVSEFGHLVAGSNIGEATLIIEAREDTMFNQSIVTQIKVRHVSYLMLNSDTVIPTRGNELLAVPVGVILMLSVSFHDATGEVFYATSSKVNFRSNRLDLLQVAHGNQNYSLVAKATGPGDTVLKVWDSTNPRLADYVAITVGHSVHPHDEQINLGDVLCFRSPIVSPEGYHGVWTAQGGVLEISADTGYATAIHVGEGTVIYNVSSLITTHSQVYVNPIESVKFYGEHVNFLTNAVHEQTSEVTVPIDITTKEGVLKTSIRGAGSNCSDVLMEAGYKARQLPLRCTVALSIRHHPMFNVHELVRVETELDLQTGKYQCRLHQLAVTDKIPMLSTLGFQVVLRVDVIAQSQSDVFSTPLYLPYLPAFYVQTSTLHLSNEMPRANLQIMAAVNVIPDLKVVSTDSNIVSVGAAEVNFDADGMVSFPITLHVSRSLWDRSALDIQLLVKCSSTGQIRHVPLEIRLIGSKDHHHKPVMLSSWSEIFSLMTGAYQNVFIIILVILAALMCVVFAYQWIVSQRYYATAAPGIFLPPRSPPPYYSGPTGSPGSKVGQKSSPVKGTLDYSGSPPRLWSVPVDYGPYDSPGTRYRRTSRSPSP